MMVTLHNDLLTAQIDPVGAQLCSVKNTAGTEYIWQADPAIWGRHAPLLFPVIGRLQNSQYTLGGRTFTIGSHGFARDSHFEVVDASPTSASFRLTACEQTLAVYPFPFILTVTYALEGNKLTKSCRVENPGSEPMYYELGGHDGFVAPLEAGEVMDDYAIILPGVDALKPYGMDPDTFMITPKEQTLPLKDGRVPLKPSVYALDTIILDDLPQRRAILTDKSGRPRVTLDFPDFPYLGIWTQPKPFDTNYVCIEPWTSLPDATFVGRGLADKAGIRTLEAGQSEVLTYITTFDERRSCNEA